MSMKQYCIGFFQESNNTWYFRSGGAGRPNRDLTTDLQRARKWSNKGHATNALKNGNWGSRTWELHVIEIELEIKNIKQYE